MREASRTTAVVNCGQLVTMSGPARPRVRDELKELAIITGGGMLIRDGRIESIGDSAHIASQAPANAEVVDAGGRVVMPGFVDAHTHAVFGGTRVDEYELRARGASYEEIAEAGGGIRSTVRKTRAASEDELIAAGRRYTRWFLQGATTTVEAKSGYGLSTDDELKILRAIRRLGETTPLRYVPTFLGAHEMPDEYRAAREQYIELVMQDMLPRVLEQRLAEFCDIFCEPKVFTATESRRILQRAKALGLKLRMHVEQLSQSGGAELAAELGAQTADHLEQVGDAGITALARAGVQPVLLPASVYALGLTRYAPARKMIDGGLAVVLATDFNPGSSPTTSMPLVLSLASTHIRMSPAEAITAATINAAYSLNRGGEVGTLEPGKCADFAIHDCTDYREIAYFAGVHLTHAVFVRGQLVYERGGAS